MAGYLNKVAVLAAVRFGTVLSFDPRAKRDGSGIDLYIEEFNKEATAAIAQLPGPQVQEWGSPTAMEGELEETEGDILTVNRGEEANVERKLRASFLRVFGKLRAGYVSSAKISCGSLCVMSVTNGNAPGGVTVAREFHVAGGSFESTGNVFVTGLLNVTNGYGSNDNRRSVDPTFKVRGNLVVLGRLTIDSGVDLRNIQLGGDVYLMHRPSRTSLNALQKAVEGAIYIYREGCVPNGGPEPGDSLASTLAGLAAAPVH